MTSSWQVIFFLNLTWTSAFCTRKVIQIGIAKIMGHSFLLFRGEIDRLQITAGGSSDDPTKTALMVKQFLQMPMGKEVLCLHHDC